MKVTRDGTAKNQQAARYSDSFGYSENHTLKVVMVSSGSGGDHRQE